MTSFFVAFAFFACLTLVIITLAAKLVARAGFPLPPDHNRIGCIDGLRGYLALSVMFHHFYLWTAQTHFGQPWGPPAIPFLNELGVGGVALFFMTTGLVFYPTILKGLRGNFWPSVYIRRVLRIVPLVAVSVAMVTAVIICRTGATITPAYFKGAALWISTHSEPPLLGYGQAKQINAGVLWSLRIEWIFYIALLPACAAMMGVVRRYQWPTWLFPIAMLVLTVSVGIVTHALHRNWQLVPYLPLFAVGMLAYEAQRGTVLRTWMQRPWAAIAGLGALLAGMSLAPTPFGWAMPLFAFFFITVACGNRYGGLFTNRGALVLGECSFGLYLLHAILLNVLFVDQHQSIASWPATILPATLPLIGLTLLGITAGTFVLVERPAIELGRKLARRCYESFRQRGRLFPVAAPAD